MDKQIRQLTNHLQEMNYGHIFYYYNEVESYIKNAVSYIVAGIEQGDHILFVENDRIYPMIHKRLKKLLKHEELTRVHFINNYDFYWGNGNFHPPTILSYFTNILGPFFENKTCIRTWGHVEWGDQEDIIREVESYESAVNEMAANCKLMADYAYDAHRLPDGLKRGLMKSHGFFMTDTDIISITN